MTCSDLGIVVLKGGRFAESSTLHSCVAQVGSSGKKKKRLHLLSIFRFWADDTQRGDSPPINRCGCCNVSRAILPGVCTPSLQHEANRLPQSLERFEEFRYLGTNLLTFYFIEQSSS